LAVSFIVRMFIESELKNCNVKTAGQKNIFYEKVSQSSHVKIVQIIQSARRNVE